MPRAQVLAPERSTTSVVIDNGSGFIKAGFAGEEDPRVVLPSTGLSGMGDSRPIRRGVVQDWDAMEAYWDHAFQQLRVDTGQCNLLVTSPLFDTKDNKERLMQCLFETFAAPGVYSSAPAIFELYATGRENGVVLGCGEECTYALLVHEGLPDARTQVRSDFAGSALTAHAAATLQRAAAGGGAPIDLATARRAKEALAVVAKDDTGATPPEVVAGQFELPDGRKLSVSPTLRAEMGEALFQPKMCGVHECGLAQLVAESIRSRDRDGPCAAQAEPSPASSRRTRRGARPTTRRPPLPSRSPPRRSARIAGARQGRNGELVPVDRPRGWLDDGAWAPCPADARARAACASRLPARGPGAHGAEARSVARGVDPRVARGG
jgi:hypothetical protein